MPQERQIYLSIISFGSVIWLVALAGVAFPSAATFLLSFVPLPEWVDRKWVRLAMLASAAVIPAIVGAVALRMVDAKDRPRTAGGVATAILRGYPSTIGLALTLVVMTVLAPILRTRDLARRWTTQHVPVIVEPADYPTVVDDVQDALRKGGIDTKRARASRALRGPTRVLAWLTGGAVGDLTADRLTRLRAPGLEVLLHPSDLVISGRAADAARVRAIIAERLPFTRAYLTWHAEANEIEDALRRIWESVDDGAYTNALAQLHAVEATMHRLAIPFEEWEVLFRQKLQVELAILRPMAHAAGRAHRDPVATLARFAPFLAAAAKLGAELVERKTGSKRRAA